MKKKFATDFNFIVFFYLFRTCIYTYKNINVKNR